MAHTGRGATGATADEYQPTSAVPLPARQLLTLVSLMRCQITPSVRQRAFRLPQEAEAFLAGVILDVARGQQDAVSHSSTSAGMSRGEDLFREPVQVRAGLKRGEEEQVPPRPSSPAACPRISPGAGLSPDSGSRSTRWCGSSRIALMQPAQAGQLLLADAQCHGLAAPSVSFLPGQGR